MRESYLVNSIIRRFYSEPRVYIWRANSGKIKTAHGTWIVLNTPGTPDLIGFIAPQGRFIGIECKVDSNKQNDNQIAFQKELEERGGIYILARTLEDAEKAILGALNA
jgi:hypothetical protein